jgi:hypothetical protein
VPNAEDLVGLRRPRNLCPRESHILAAAKELSLEHDRFEDD